MHDKELGDRKWEVFNLTCLEFRGLTEKIELYIVKKRKKRKRSDKAGDG